LHNELAPWCESAPHRLSFTQREKGVVDRGFPAERRDSLLDALSDVDGPHGSSLFEQFPIFAIQAFFDRFLW